MQLLEVEKSLVLISSPHAQPHGESLHQFWSQAANSSCSNTIH